MKKISPTLYFLLFLFSLLNLSSSKVNAQTYYFMNDSATWKVNHFDAYGYGHDEYKYYLAGDTIINSKFYKKLRVKTFDEPNTFFDTYTGAIRSDSILQKVYLVYPGQSDEMLLYDFSLNVGDTINTWLGSGWVVFKIDSILIGNQLHKRLSYDIGWGIDTLCLIEGVGSYSGLLQAFSDNTFEIGSQLACFKVGEQFLYSSYIDSSQIICDLPIPLDVSISSHNFGIQIFNNLNADVLTVENATSEKLSIKLFDELGREHLNQSSSSTKFQFSTSSLAAGIYFVECVDESNTFLLSQTILVK